ncbi:MAG: hypothetical protein VKJ46_01735 [Leptolyngbyaceae bacterium]|nr:hypothetical protein [Leptolyngbyaceae bacterium]
MTPGIVNVTVSAIATEVETVLETYPDHPYQQAFAIPELRQKLITYVLNRIPSNYVVTEQRQELLVSLTPLPDASAEEICPPALVHQGIQQVLRDSEDQVSHHIPEDIDPDSAPSQWFG